MGVVFSFSLSLFLGLVPLNPGIGFGGSRTIGENKCGHDDEDDCSCDDNVRDGARALAGTSDDCVDDCVVVVVSNVSGVVVVAVETTQLLGVLIL